MANTNSIRKIQEYLESKEQPVALSKIGIQNGLSKRAVLECIEVLKNYKDIQILSNGSTTLIQLKNMQKEESENATTIPN